MQPRAKAFIRWPLTSPPTSHSNPVATAQGATAIPQGPLPAEILFKTAPVFTSTTETSFDGPLAVYNFRPSGEIPMPHGRVPIPGKILSTWLVATSITTIAPPRPQVTYAVSPLGD